MNPDLLSIDETEVAKPTQEFQLSRTDLAVNRWIDIAEAFLDRFIFTPLLGPNQAATR